MRQRKRKRMELSSAILLIAQCMGMMTFQITTLYSIQPKSNPSPTSAALAGRRGISICNPPTTALLTSSTSSALTQSEQARARRRLGGGCILRVRRVLLNTIEKSCQQNIDRLKTSLGMVRPQKNTMKMRLKSQNTGKCSLLKKYRLTLQSHISRSSYL